MLIRSLLLMTVNNRKEQCVFLKCIITVGPFQGNSFKHFNLTAYVTPIFNKTHIMKHLTDLSPLGHQPVFPENIQLQLLVPTSPFYFLCLFLCCFFFWFCFVLTGCVGGSVRCRDVFLMIHSFVLISPLRKFDTCYLIFFLSHLEKKNK